MKRWLEKILMKSLALDPESAARIQKLAGRVVKIELKGTPVRFQMIFKEGGVEWLWENFVPEDLLIAATPLSFLQLKTARGREGFSSGDVTVTGNMLLAQEVMALFDQFDPDWEEWLSGWVGDVPAHSAGRLVRRIRGFAREAGQRLAGNVSEYLQEEAALCPPRRALQDFYRDVDDLRLSLDRLEARLTRLRGLS